MKELFQVSLRSLPTYFFIGVLIVSIILIVHVIWKSKKKRDSAGDSYETDIYDDVFPLPRRINTDNKTTDESDFHLKLNYQVLIEVLTRKLFFLFFAIIIFATGFIFVLYTTSLSEAIAPHGETLSEYKEMMDTILYVEGKMNELQLNQVQTIVESTIKYETFGENTVEKKSEIFENLYSSILAEHVKKEDELLVDVSKEFFNIYYITYIIVRLFVATVMFTILTYLMKLYFQIREDRNDYIRKEEALSTYFSVIDYIEGYDPRKKRKRKERFTTLRDSIPAFPLTQLFLPSSNNKKQKNVDSNLLVQTMNTIQKLSEQQITFIKHLSDELFKDRRGKANENNSKEGSHNEEENNSSDESNDDPVE